MANEEGSRFEELTSNLQSVIDQIKGNIWGVANRRCLYNLKPA